MKFKSVISEYKQWGFWRFLQLCLMQSVRPWLFWCVVIVRPLNPKPLTRELPANRKVRLPSKEELLQACNDPELVLDPLFVTEALDRGDYCIAVFEEEEIIAYAWITTTTAPHEDGLWIEIAPNQAYGYKSLTKKRARRQGLQYFVLHFTDNLLIQQGKTHIVGTIETHNFPSRFSNVGSSHGGSGYAGYLMLLGKVFTLRTPKAKRCGFRFFIPKDKQNKN